MTEAVDLAAALHAHLARVRLAAQDNEFIDTDETERPHRLVHEREQASAPSGPAEHCNKRPAHHPPAAGAGFSPRRPVGGPAGW